MDIPNIDNLTHTVIASVSGGKDSTALCLHLKERGIPYIAVHMDTGWEHPDTDQYIREVLPQHIGPIEWIVPERTMIPLIHHKAMFPSRVRRYCTQFLKVFPLQQWLDDRYGPDVVNAVGIRAAESAARSKLDEWEHIEWAWTWRPLIGWSEQNVIDIHTRNNVRPNPLYLKGAARVGCWPCIFARKEEIRTIANTDPARIDLIRQLETEVVAAAAARYAARGETFESLDYCQPTFFALKKAVPGPDGIIVRKNVCVPIDEVVQWSRTSHGGRQFDLFSNFEDERSGCMKWGLCDSD